MALVVAIRALSTASRASALAAPRGRILDGTATAKAIRAELKAETAAFVAATDITPGLGVVLVGGRRDSQTYVRMKCRAAAEIGYRSVDVALADDADEAAISAAVDALNADPAVHGILVQLPLPEGVDERRVLERVLPEKDVDGFALENVARLALTNGLPPKATPCTPAGVIELLRRYGVGLAGVDAVVLGRSNVVGAPMAALLQQCDATVTVCHSGTRDVAAAVKRADVVVAALGSPGFVRGSWLKPGAVVVDVGINAVPDDGDDRGYRLVGDVAFDEAVGVASLITPVPGGVGPMTIAMLMSNVLNLTRASAGLDPAPQPGRLAAKGA